VTELSTLTERGPLDRATVVIRRRLDTAASFSAVEPEIGACRLRRASASRGPIAFIHATTIAPATPCRPCSSLTFL